MLGILTILMWSEPILHVDMDSFFVEVERLADPTLRGRPVAVGGTGGRGVIASASYEARRFGVKSAQPTVVAQRLCPELVVVSPAHGRYGEFSAAVFEIFRSVTPLVEGLSLDEAFLDVAGLRNHYDGSEAVAVEIRARLRAELGLPASVGIASNKFLAKLASEAAKPDGIRRIRKETELEFLHALGVDALWGVGPATLAGLQRLGIETVGDLASVPEDTLRSVLGPSHAAHLAALASGIDLRKVEPDSNSKSVSVEETYSEDLVERDLIESAILAHSQRLAARLRRSGLSPRTLTLKVKFSDFTTVTRSRTYPHAVTEPREFYRGGLELLSEVPDGLPLRLIGLGASSFEDGSAPHQISIDADDAWHRMGKAVADVQDRYGVRSIEPARLVDWANKRGHDSDE